jgi:hypothetical protein
MKKCLNCGEPLYKLPQPPDYEYLDTISTHVCVKCGLIMNFMEKDLVDILMEQEKK